MTLQRAVQFQKLLRPPSFISAEHGDQFLRVLDVTIGFWYRGLVMRPLRILNVAEKNDAAKELSRIMSRGHSLRVKCQIFIIM